MIIEPRPLVLLVEDEMLIALDIEEMISGFGFRVAPTVNSRQGALAAIRHQRPDIALIDGNLADGPTGVRIAEDLSQAGVLCIAVTANPELFDGCECVDEFLPKPIEESGLKSALVRAEVSVRQTPLADPPQNREDPAEG